MSSKKFGLTVSGGTALLIIAILFIATGQFEPMLWGGWFLAFTGTLGLYFGANVAQKSVQGKNYNESLSTKK